MFSRYKSNPELQDALESATEGFSYPTNPSFRKRIIEIHTEIVQNENDFKGIVYDNIIFLKDLLFRIPTYKDGVLGDYFLALAKKTLEFITIKDTAYLLELYIQELEGPGGLIEWRRQEAEMGIQRYIQQYPEGRRQRIASSERTDITVLEYLANDKSAAVRTNVAYNVKTPPYILDMLSNDVDYFVRQGIADNPNTPIKTLIRLAYDENIGVQFCLANRPHVDTRILNILSISGHKKVRVIIAKNVNTPQHILVRLSNDKDLEVRIGVATNRNTPHAVIKRMSRYDMHLVRASIAKVTSDVEILSRLSNDSSDIVKVHVALNTNTPTSVLHKLAGDASIEVRRVVVVAPLPLDILYKLSNDPSSEVRRIAIMQIENIQQHRKYIETSKAYEARRKQLEERIRGRGE